MNNEYFYLVIKNLRLYEDILLYDNLLQINENEILKVQVFLEDQFQQESYTFPFESSVFDKDAAIWSAKIVYHTAQLILYREHEIENHKSLFADFQGEINASSILSADLCLRFIPSMLIQLKMIDNEDGLINILEELLQKWHFSAINYSLEIEQLNFENILNNNCLLQLYVNRVIENKKLKLALHPNLLPSVKASLGMFTSEFWNEFKIELQANE